MAAVFHPWDLEDAGTTYDEFRRSVKTGDMLLWQSKPTGNLRHDTEIEAVQVSTESPWTHVGIAWVEYGRAWAMDLTVTGCAPRLLAKSAKLQAWINAPRAGFSRAGLLYAFSRFHGKCAIRAGRQYWAISGDGHRQRHAASARSMSSRSPKAAWRHPRSLPRPHVWKARCWVVGAALRRIAGGTHNERDDQLAGHG